MIVKTDFLVVGSGIAGLLTALELAKSGQVILVTKTKPTESNTLYAQGGIAAVVATDDDSFEEHIQDTLVAGDGLCNKKVVEAIIQQAPSAISLLEQYGVRFETNESGYKRSREGAHKKNRVLYYQDTTGREIEEKLYASAAKHPQILILSHHHAVDLIMEYKLSKVSSSKKTCWGAFVYDVKNNEVVSIGAKKTVLATGGAGKIYLYTSNPDVSTGDGIAMAMRAGAAIENMEFMQFHPTTLYHPYAKNFLITEAVRGEGGVLKDYSGQPFMQKYHPMKSLAPRDVVARAIDNEMKSSGVDHMYLDISMKSDDFIRERFPNILAKCKEYNIDITKDMIPVVPAAHYTCGGVRSDINGHTDIENLFAVGETASTGFHGANRLASNSLLEGAVMATNVSRVAVTEAAGLEIPALDDWESPTTPRHENVIINHDWDELRRTMWNFVGIVRSDKRLLAAMRRIELIEEEIREFYYANPLSVNLLEMRNIIINAKVTVRAALWRKESRGIHYTLDYPEKDPKFEQLFSSFTKKDVL